MELNINKQRMIKNFTDLVRIDSLSGKEKKVAVFLEKILKNLGAKVYFDRAKEKTCGSVGNLIAKIDGIQSMAPFLLCAHMDTVIPGENIKPIVKKDRIISDGHTILGADCKAGIAIILETLYILKEKKVPHCPIEVVFTISEEIGLLGSKYLDYSQIKSRYGLIFDSEKPLNEVTTSAPAANKMEIKVYGVEAHAGVCPEKGISAIKIASSAISQMKLGRIDFETTANIGMIQGGGPTNIITPFVEMKGEARSHNIKKLQKQTRHMENCFKKAINKIKVNGNFTKPKYEFNIQRAFPNLSIKSTNPVLKLIESSMNEMDMKMKIMPSGGGTDANIFYGHGIETPILATGMREVHTTREYLDLKDFFNCTKLVLKIITKWR